MFSTLDRWSGQRGTGRHIAGNPRAREPACGVDARAALGGEQVDPADVGVVLEPAQQVVGAGRGQARPRGRRATVATFEISPTEPLTALGPGMSAVTSPTAPHTTCPLDLGHDDAHPVGPARSANQSCAARRHAGSAIAAEAVPIASNMTARSSTSAAASAGVATRTTASSGRHRRGPEREPATGLGAALGGVGQVPPRLDPPGGAGVGPLLHRRAHRPRRRRGCRPRRPRRSRPSSAPASARSAPMRSTISRRDSVVRCDPGFSRVPPAAAGKTPCQRAARSSERCRARPGTSMPTHHTGGCGRWVGIGGISSGTGRALKCSPVNSNGCPPISPA